MNVLDSSAVLAIAKGEPGALEVEKFLDGALILSVNLAEVLQKAPQVGVDPTRLSDLLADLGLGVIPFDKQLALDTAALWPLTRTNGLSLADRACLAAAAALNAIAVTTDRSWIGLDVDVAIHVIER